MTDDRTVHAKMRTLDGDTLELVRYDKSGTWYTETTGTKPDPMTGRRAVEPKRTRVNMSTAVGIALLAHKAENGEWFHARPGGRTLDARVRRAIESKRR